MSEKSCRRAMLCIVCYYEKSCKGVISQDGGSSMSEKSCRRAMLCIVCYYEK